MCIYDSYCSDFSGVCVQFVNLPHSFGGLEKSHAQHMQWVELERRRRY